MLIRFLSAESAVLSHNGAEAKVAQSLYTAPLLMSEMVCQHIPVLSVKQACSDVYALRHDCMIVYARTYTPSAGTSRWK